ncbi:MAG: hypothetical protein A2X52_12610 [Candidatus Rokubacteria bacterium GWC2_70_16]|nr:MAG: hypothetical protein A2X52_12610 [Candidatus Rokubacteria bacterium GWC2_70_16]OGL20008.1 MAG: hypothetical protein A3K12_13040 [Candidatus Rokubacteria bacterium RIFCSPLOWO2_12_FULL_71_19]
MDWPIDWSGPGVSDALIQSIMNALGWAMLVAFVILLPLAVLFSPMTRHRRFWCAQSRRDVEVEFALGGLPGFGRPVAVRWCSVFDPPTAVRCRRLCLEASYRRRWNTASPLRHTGAG